MLFYESYSLAQGMDWKYRQNKLLYIDTYSLVYIYIDTYRYIHIFCSIIFRESSELAAEAAALDPLAAVAANVTHVKMALALLPAVSRALQKKEEGKKLQKQS